MAGDPIKLSNLPTEMTVPPAGDDLLVVVDTSAAETKKIKNSTLMQAVTGPRGFMINGKLSVTVASNNLTVAVKTLAGTDPTAADPVYVRIGDTVRVIVAALSVTAAAATNWCNAGSAELATKEIDYFVYLGYNATDGVVLGFSRIPYARQYSDFNATSTNEKYAAISTITNAAAGDYYENIGRFAATLSAGAGYTWTVPTFTAANLINRPIYESRWLDWAPVIAGYSSNPTSAVYEYRADGDNYEILIRENGDGTSTTGSTTYSLPFTSVNVTNLAQGNQGSGNDNGLALTTPIYGAIIQNTNSLIFYKDLASTAFTTSGTKRIRTFWMSIRMK